MDALDNGTRPRWYSGITGYQWTVLAIASLGWVFDVFEGQIFVASMNEAMKSLLPSATPPGEIDLMNNIALASFLIGGALGGVVFGSLSDRIGRTRTMVLTILMYSCFTCVTAFAQSWWQMVGLRFLVAMGVGGEWAVASAMVAEVFPRRARAWSGAIFHGSSVFGTFLASIVGMLVVANENLGWRWGFAVGALPALLTLWVRWRLREPEQWVEARRRGQEDRRQRTGRIHELFSRAYLRSTLLGLSLAAVGLATFWGVHIFGKDVLRREAERHYLAVEGVPPDAAGDVRAAALEEHFPDIKRAEMLGMILVTAGGGLGLVAFGPLCERLGRRGAFVFYHAGGFAAAVLLFRYLTEADPDVLWVALPVFGFLTLGMHAGYAVYFPELFPTRLRGTGAGFCFNIGRILAAPILILKGWLQHEKGYSFDEAALLLSWLFLLGIVVIAFAPETRGRELPE